ncbi:MAG: hypothetical protein QM756_15715 [Polyangiaceae bacterium]
MKSTDRPSPMPRCAQGPWPLARWGALLGGFSLLLVSAPSRAEDSARVRAEANLKSLTALTAEQSVIGPLLTRAKKALERADSARRANDTAHGSQLEALALELTDAANDLVRTHAAEQQGTAAQQKALDLETRVVRARALVEQGAARRGRASERLQTVEAEKGKPAPSKAGKKPAAPPGATPPATAPAPAKAPVPSTGAKP